MGGATCRPATLITRCIHTQGGKLLPRAQGEGYKENRRAMCKRDPIKKMYGVTLMVAPHRM
jgi:hypothetical protein